MTWIRLNRLGLRPKRAFFPYTVAKTTRAFRDRAIAAVHQSKKRVGTNRKLKKMKQDKTKREFPPRQTATLLFLHYLIRNERFLSNHFFSDRYRQTSFHNILTLFVCFCLLFCDFLPHLFTTMSFYHGVHHVICFCLV